MRRRPTQIEIDAIAFEGFDQADGTEASQALERALAPLIARGEPRGDSLSASIARAVQKRLLP